MCMLFGIALFLLMRSFYALRSTVLCVRSNRTENRRDSLSLSFSRCSCVCCGCAHCGDVFLFVYGFLFSFVPFLHAKNNTNSEHIFVAFALPVLIFFYSALSVCMHYLYNKPLKTQIRIHTQSKTKHVFIVNC